MIGTTTLRNIPNDWNYKICNTCEIQFNTNANKPIRYCPGCGRKIIIPSESFVFCIIPPDKLRASV